MLRKLLLLMAALGLVVALPSPADAQSVDAVGTATIQGSVASSGPSADCPATAYSNTGTFSDFVMAGTFRAGDATYVGEVEIAPAGSTITACTNAYVTVASNPIVSEGDIQGDLADDGDGSNGTAGGFAGSNDVGSDLDGDIDRGGFTTVGTAAAVHFSIDYDVTAGIGGSDSAENVSCAGAFAVAPLEVINEPNEILGAIGCLQVT